MVYAHVYGPEAPASGAVAQIFAVVAGAEEYAPARVYICAPAVWHAKDVLVLGKELLYAAHFAAVHGFQLAHFDDPHALHQLAGFFALERFQAVREPAEAHFAQQRALADALRACQHGHAVEFRAGHQSPCHRGAERFTRHCAGVYVVVCAQVVHVQGLQPGRSVPHKALQIFAHRVAGVCAATERQSVHDLFLSGDVVGPFDVPADTRVVVVAPDAPSFTAVPGKGPPCHGTACKFVQRDAVPEPRVIVQDKENIVHGVVVTPGVGMTFQAAHPVRGFFRAFPRGRGKSCRRFGITL